ncbi:hypothetical protein [Microcoleus sp. PH2017_32_RDM_D_A]|uniref:hypothetical protein n=1 Tax=Microcoleus sp. PH2017_32_RDM_D_A TaxID=2798842 RepID=UPI0025E21299|nr:hypothetical protein [Microcoleus sp. PH2017_32_RDM_D_A]
MCSRGGFSPKYFATIHKIDKPAPFIFVRVTRNNWLKASGFGVEIKRRRFITPILFLPGGRDCCQLSTVNCQLSTE